MGIEKFGVNDITFLAAAGGGGGGGGGGDLPPPRMTLILRAPSPYLLLREPPPPFLSRALFESPLRLTLVVKLPHKKFKVANSSPYISN